MSPQPKDAARRALNRLRTPAAVADSEMGGLESLGLEVAEAVPAPPEEPVLTDDRIRTSLERARERFRRISERAGAGDLTDDQRRVLADAESALRRLSSQGDSADLDDDQMIGLEAVVVQDGTRPALFVQDDDVDPTVPDAGSWRQRIEGFRPAISQVARSVGRINIALGAAGFMGTGWVVAPGLVMTNRHVLEELAGLLEPGLDGVWHFVKPVTIDFAAEFQRKRRREFTITGVAFAGPDPIRRTLKTTNLDVALLTVEQHNGVESLPEPLALSRRGSSINGQAEVYVMGYPARPLNAAGEVMKRIFADEYDVKRFAPGFVLDDPDAFVGGQQRVFTHDPSTLQGNSGSCVVEFSRTARPVVGLHFGGFANDRNFAHAIARIEDVLTTHGAVLED